MTRRTDPLTLVACFTHSGQDFEPLKAAARSAERGKFDALDYTAPAEHFEPLILMSALAAITEHIGLIATARDPEPYHIARKLASLDHLSNGRAAWRVASEPTINLAEERHAVVRDLWDSWDDDAFVRDKTSGRYFDPGKLHTLNHKGEHFSVRGPLNVARPPQGHPVLIHASTTEADKTLAAREADLVFTTPGELPAAQALYRDIKQRAAASGRDPNHIRVLVAANPLTDTPNDIAEHFDAWFQSRACDGFTVLFADAPGAIDTFVDQVIPLLQQRELFRHEYTGNTLREHLGLPRPANRFSVAAQPQAALI